MCTGMGAWLHVAIVRRGLDIGCLRMLGARIASTPHHRTIVSPSSNEWLRICMRCVPRKRSQVVALAHKRGISLDRVSAPVTAPRRTTGLGAAARCKARTRSSFT